MDTVHHIQMTNELDDSKRQIQAAAEREMGGAFVNVVSQRNARSVVSPNSLLLYTQGTIVKQPQLK